MARGTQSPVHTWTEGGWNYKINSRGTIWFKQKDDGNRQWREYDGYGFVPARELARLANQDRIRTEDDYDDEGYLYEDWNDNF